MNSSCAIWIWLCMVLFILRDLDLAVNSSCAIWIWLCMVLLILRNLAVLTPPHVLIWPSVLLSLFWLCCVFWLCIPGRIPYCVSSCSGCVLLIVLTSISVLGMLAVSIPVRYVLLLLFPSSSSCPGFLTKSSTFVLAFLLCYSHLDHRNIGWRLSLACLYFLNTQCTLGFTLIVFIFYFLKKLNNFEKYLFFLLYFSIPLKKLHCSTRCLESREREREKETPLPLEPQIPLRLLEDRCA